MPRTGARPTKNFFHLSVLYRAYAFFDMNISVSELLRMELFLKLSNVFWALLKQL